MPRLSKSDAALRAVVLNTKNSLKTRIAALKAMAAPSTAFLSMLLSGHPKLVIAAVERLAEVEASRKRRDQEDAALKWAVQQYPDLTTGGGTDE